MRLSRLFADTDLAAQIHEIEIDAITRINSLTLTQRKVMEGIVAGLSSKVIAHQLGTSPRTVEKHRCAVMERTGCRSMLAMTRLLILSGE